MGQRRDESHETQRNRAQTYVEVRSGATRRDARDGGAERRMGLSQPPDTVLSIRRGAEEEREGGEEEEERRESLA